MRSSFGNIVVPVSLPSASYHSFFLPKNIFLLFLGWLQLFLEISTIFMPVLLYIDLKRLPLIYIFNLWFLWFGWLIEQSFFVFYAVFLSNNTSIGITNLPSFSSLVTEWNFFSAWRANFYIPFHFRNREELPIILLPWLRLIMEGLWFEPPSPRKMQRGLLTVQPFNIHDFSFNSVVTFTKKVKNFMTIRSNQCLLLLGLLIIMDCHRCRLSPTMSSFHRSLEFCKIYTSK